MDARGSGFFEHMNVLIAKAEKIIHLQIYLIDPDETGNLLMGALITAAKRGVEINLVIDDFGSAKLSEAETQKLIEAGINVKRFEPFLASDKFYVGRRMHHKIMVVDEKFAMVAGVNIADRYRGSTLTPPWLDYGVFVEGPVCKELAIACVRIMERKFIPASPKWPKLPRKGKGLNVDDEVWVRIRKNDWLRNKREITQSYNKASQMATKSITIVGGYFLPGRKYRRILANASRKGVEIKIIMTHFSDVPTVKYASDYLYGWMLRNNIRIFESKTSMVHGKVAIVDETWSTIGSYNQNHLSAYLSIELNLDIVNREFSTNFHNHLLEVIDKECIEVTQESYYRNSSVFSKLRRWTSYQLVRISLRMLFIVNRIFGIND
ncbi:MAG: hypothetical protein IPP71_12715 [Bacteroidetes bacterium]|nr:hypothetical protein [Bacteroidota bacterium]